MHLRRTLLTGLGLTGLWLAGLGLAGFALVAPVWSRPASADPVARHALALLGEPALPAGFTHFPWVNPDAPKGGEVTLGVVGTFDSFNPYIVRGQPAAASAQLFDTLLAPNPDEPSAEYARIAESVAVAEDRLGVTFRLNPAARFSDGTPVTAEDVVWSFNILRAKGQPRYRQYWADVTDAVVDGPRQVSFRFRTAANRELATILGELPVLPRHFWEGRDFDRPLAEPPVGSGPYRVGRFEFGRSLTLERIPDWWAANLPSARGRYNFDKIRSEFFRDGTVAMEAFKAGQIDYRQENISKDWATAYDFPAVAKGWVKRAALRHRLPTGMQGWAMNTRRPVFADRRLRQAIAEVFDFEWANANLFHGAYTRTESYFSNSDLASSGVPEGAELALLEPWRASLPAEVFSTPFHLPATDGSGNNRAGLRRALDLLRAAGWQVKDRRLINDAGQPLAFEILLNDPSLERVALPYKQWLSRLGVDVSVRTVDPAQYQRRLDTYDYDMVMAVIPQSDSPGNEQGFFWSCEAAHQEGGENLMGVCDPAVDALTREVVTAPDRAHLLTAAHALDRVLLWGWYMVPNWHLQSVWLAYWDRFGRPEAAVRPGVVFDSWWIDPARDAALSAARAGN